MDRRTQQRKDDQFLHSLWSAGSALVVTFRGLTIPVGENDAPVYSSSASFDVADAVLLGVADGVAYFALQDAGVSDHASRWTELRDVMNRLGAAELSMLAYARGMMHWHATHRFCSRCGNLTVSRSAGHERHCLESGCAAVFYPRVDPAVIVLITYGERALMGRHNALPTSMYSTLAGFVEVGESLEQAVRREMHEEVGLKLQNIRYFGSQPWPFPSSLMLAFTAEAETDQLIIDRDELTDARWLSREELENLLANGEIRIPPEFSIARSLIDHWRRSVGEVDR